MKNKKVLLVVGVLIVIVMSVFVYNNYRGEEEDVVRIGVIAPLTGPLATYGQAFQNGIIMAIEDLNIKDINFIFEDSKYDPALAISAYRKLVDINNVDIVIDWGSATGNAIIPLVDLDKTPFVAFNFDNALAKKSEYTISPYSPPVAFSSKIWEYMREENINKLGIVKVQLPYFDLLLEGLEESKIEGEEVIVIDTLQFQDTDFKTSIEKIKRSDIEALGVFLVSGQISQFYKQSEQLGLDIKTFGSDFFEDYEEINNSGSGIEGAVYPNMQVSEDFKRRYKDRFGDESQITVAGHSYDVIAILSLGKENLNREEFFSFIKGIDGFVGVLGNYSYSEVNGYKHLDHDVYIKKISNGEIIPINY